MDAEPRHGFAPPLPLLMQRRSRAWAISFAVHAAVLGLGIWLIEHAVTPPPPEAVRMIYVEPAPPPAPPLGAPVSARVAPVVEPAIERPQEILQPQRLIAPRKPKRAAPDPVVVPRGDPQGSVGGVIGGVGGGEAGGQVGGLVGGRGDIPIPAGQVEHPPVAISRVLPVYPSMARARNLEGHVVLRAVIDRDGRVEDAITVVESEPMFDAAAVAALRKWRFEPGRGRDGKTVRVLIDLPIRFQLR